MIMNSEFTLLNLFIGGDIVIAAASLAMVVGSIMSWGIIIGKIRLWRKVKRFGLNRTLSPDDIIKPFDKNLWFLSMASTVAPFIGLFGTVWGVMRSFAAIGATKSVSLAAIAPGLAAALGTTVLGLVVAIPAAVAYNYFQQKSDGLYNGLANEKR